jgi:hypothetical protein
LMKIKTSPVKAGEVFFRPAQSPGSSEPSID